MEKTSKLIPFTSCQLPRDDDRHNWATGYVKYWTECVVEPGNKVFTPPDSGDFISAVVIDEPDTKIKFMVCVDERIVGEYASKWEVNYEYAIMRIPAAAVQIIMCNDLTERITLRIQYILAQNTPTEELY